MHEDRDETERARRGVFDAETARRTDPDHVTLENLSPLEVQVRALREDLSAYRWAIERILRRRLWALAGVVSVVIVAVAVIGIGAGALLAHESDRSRLVLEAARLEACSAARTVQGQVATILAGLEDRDEGAPEWLEDAIATVSTDPCPVHGP